MKVIHAGYPKSGTKSLAKALKILGYDKVYDYPEAIEFGFDEWEKILNNKSSNIDEVIDKVYADGVEAVVDQPHAFFFEKFFRRWPNAKVVFTVREEDKQYQSFQYMMDDAFKLRPTFNYLMRIFSPAGRRYWNWNKDLITTIMTSCEASQLKWTECVRRQLAYVKEVVPEDQLLIFDVREGWEPLCKFLGKPVPKGDFPFVNRRGGQDTVSNQQRGSKIVRKVESEVKASLILSSIFLCITAVLVALVM